MTQRRPYLGLRPYEYTDRENFFGREAECEILIDKLLSNRLTLLFAASGVGKSSLLRAAVLPKLKDPLGENLTVIYHNDWVKNPLAALRNNVLKAVPVVRKVSIDKELPEVLELCGLFSRHPFVIVLDQFEEFFRYQEGKPDFEIIVHQLTSIILNDKIPVSIVISMREDFALKLNVFKSKLPTLLFENFFRLERMHSNAAKEAIVKPALRFGYEFEPSLLKELVAELGREVGENSDDSDFYGRKTRFIEPAYLQIVCFYLWELKETDGKKCIRLSSYNMAGGASGILKGFLSKTLARFTWSQKQLISKAFDYLAVQGEYKMAYHVDVLAKIIDVDVRKIKPILDALSRDDVRVLRSQTREGVIWYELYHDILAQSVLEWNDQRKKSQEWWSSGYLFALVLVSAASGILFSMLSHEVEIKSEAEVSWINEKRFNLIKLGVVAPPLPEMVLIPPSNTPTKIGELSSEWLEIIDPEFKSNFANPSSFYESDDGFEISKFEIKNEEYKFYVWSQLQKGINRVGDWPLEYPSIESVGIGDSLAYVSWVEAQAYTKWLSEMTGDKYRLPTEAEWEYALRGGTETDFWWGDDKPSCADCDNSEIASIEPKENMLPNPFGLYEMTGGLWEWTCSDFTLRWEGEERKCSDGSSGIRVVRGGSSNDKLSSFRSSSREARVDDYKYEMVGFRVIKTLN